MRILKFTPIILLVALTAFACKKESTDPAELIQGKWIITSSEILGVEVPGDGSYLTFDACAASCTGTDYRASDQTTGAITYTLNEDATLITIVDNSADGGSYNGTWDVLELNENNFRITVSTLLGNLKVEMSQ
ncbi:MAG: hypothetical protein ACI837_000673 [Crocinitomicaceae bacterium]|jgi:hypothetical protein